MVLVNRSFLKKYKLLAFFRIFFNPFFLFSPILAFKKLIYNPKKDLDRNTELLIDLELDIEKIKLQLKEKKTVIVPFDNSNFLKKIKKQFYLIDKKNIILAPIHREINVDY